MRTQHPPAPTPRSRGEGRGEGQSPLARRLPNPLPRAGEGARRLPLAWAFAALLLIAASATAQTPREIHGRHDAFAAPGIALAWGVLRGATEAATTLVIRVIADPATYPRVAARGKDPFSGQTQALFPPAPTQRPVDIRIPRDRFADFPRTEILLYAPGAADTAPTVVVYYLGVPDTTPELATAAALDASLGERIVRARDNAGKSP